MEAMIFLLPIVLGLGLVFAWLFILAARDGQFDDLDDPPRRMLQDDWSEEQGKVGGEE
jgi:cbb3-type cytochrome oxidase maturation protein